MNAQTLIALFQIVTTLIAAVQKARWYNEGAKAYAAQQKAEQDARVAAAQKALNAPPDPGPDGDPDELP